MDLSINGLKKLNKNLNFKGVKNDYNIANAPVFKFYAPPFNSKEENVTLELIPLTSGKSEFSSDKDIHRRKFIGDTPIELGQDSLKKNANTFAYRYKITNTKTQKTRYTVDSFKTIDINIDGKEEKFNIIRQGQNYGATPKMGAMRHSFVDSDAIKDLNQNGIKKQDKDFVRNHFNKLGGSLSGLTYLLEKHELDPYRYIISTPDIGVDKISSHKYWPNNQYQCNNIDEFKTFVYELYKKGKGYVADGAFTSQGLQSPLVHHALKWGEDSPFYNMLKIDSEPGLGIIPNRSNDEKIGDYDYIGVKLINNPYSEEYDSKKPIYLQLFDTRLTSRESALSNELIKEYDKLPDDHYDITTHQDSVLPYYFEIKNSDYKRLNIFKDKKRIITLNNIINPEEFLKFDNFSIVKKSKASGAAFWAGNRDIIKMNLSNPTSDSSNVEGFFNARNYLYGVASFWTETIQSDLILKTAQMSEGEKKKVALANEISSEDYENNILKMIDDSFYPVLIQNKTISQYIDEFPLQSIETHPNLSAIFSEPNFNKKLLEPETKKIISDFTNAIIETSMPEKYRKAKLSKVESVHKEYEQYKTYAVKTLAPQIIKSLYALALTPDGIDSDGKINLEALAKVSTNSIGCNSAQTVDKERKIVEEYIRKGLDNISVENISTIQKYAAKELQNVSLKDFKLAETIVLKGHAGLNWRFDAAKDIGDMDAIGSSTDFNTIWKGTSDIPGVEAFWTKFISNIKQYNPSAYIISEITDIGNYIEGGWGPGNANANAFEAEFLEKTGSTTSSNYSDYFNSLATFAGVQPEDGSNDAKGAAGNVSEIKNKIESVLNKSQPNTALLTHMFTNNHDKPRILHAMPLNMQLFLYGNQELCNEDDKNIIAELIDNTAGSACSQAVAVGLLMYKEIDKSNLSDGEKENLKKSLKNLVNGRKEEGDEYNSRRALAFGVLPYEITIRDLFKGAGINDEEKIKNFNFSMMENSIKLQISVWEMMNAIVGTPTIYNGDEFFQTGYETPSKNKYVGNRNQVLHELKDDPRYKEYYETIQSITGLYKEPGMSAIRDGAPILCNVVSDNPLDKGKLDYFYNQIGSLDEKKLKRLEELLPEDAEINTKDDSLATSEEIEKEFKICKDSDNHNHAKLHEYFNKYRTKFEEYFKYRDDSKNIKPFSYLPIFKYDDKGSKVLALLTNNGIAEKLAFQMTADDTKKEIHKVSEIPVEKDGVPLFEEGTILKRKILVNGKYIDDNKNYIVKTTEQEDKDKKKVSHTVIKALDGKDIELKNTVEYFYIPKSNDIKCRS